MSYQVLARKYRPRGFDDVVGQDHVTTPLRNAIRTSRIPHAILLTGPRGTGKTTLARIFACCLNAEGGATDAPNPDDPACLEIQAGTSTDVQEIDAASRTSVDDVREIIESIRYAAAPGKHRIFIVDEVHMLSTPAFNALLKTLEEPPPMSLFVFCTTNPEKIPFTVVSRCQRYDLRRIATAEVAENLGNIAKEEGLEVSSTSLLAVARAGDGSMRDSLTLLDQLIAFGGEKVDDTRVAEVLDLIDRNVLVSIITACLDGDSAAALTTCRHAWESGVDAKRLGGELLGLIRDLVVMRIAPDAGLVEGADAEVTALRELSGHTDEVRLRRMFRALLREQEDLAWAPDPFAVLEVALIRLATMPSGDQVEQLLARIDALERQMRGGGTGGGGGGNAARSGASSARGQASPSGGAQANAAPVAKAAPADRSPEPKARETTNASQTEPATAAQESRAPAPAPSTPTLAADTPPPAPKAVDPERAAIEAKWDAAPSPQETTAPTREQQTPGTPEAEIQSNAARDVAAAEPRASAMGAATDVERQAIAPAEPATSVQAAGPTPESAPSEPRANGTEETESPPTGLAAAPAPARQESPPDPSPPGRVASDVVRDLNRETTRSEPVEPDWAGPEGGAPSSSGAPLALVFDRLRAFAQDQNRGLFAALEGGRLLEQSDDLLKIQVIGGVSSRRLESRSAELQEVCESFFGRSLRVQLVAEEESTRSWTQKETLDVAATPEGKRQRQDALNHPVVNAALDILGGEILEIKPVGGPGASPGR